MRSINRHTVFLRFLASGFLFLVAACEPTPVRIGFTGQMTGAYSDFGVQGRNGARLAAEEINGQGGINGRRVEILVVDDGGTPDGAVRADIQLIRHGVVAVIGHMTSEQCLAALPTTQAAGVPLISPTASSPSLSGRRDLFFRVQPSIEKGPHALARYLAWRRPFWKVCTIRDLRESDYTEPWEKAFARSYRGAGGSFLCRLTYSQLDGRDLERIVAAAKAPHPDAVVLISSAADAVRLASLFLHLSPGTEIYAASWAQTDDLLSHRDEVVERIRIVSDILPMNASDKLRRFSWNYKKRYGVRPSFAAVRSYEAVHLLAAALMRAGTRTDLLPQVLTTLGSVPGLYGPIELDPFGDAVGTYYMVGVRSGRFIVTDRIPGEAK
ncbi:MAG: Extracellular ligand-binding receptor [Desulfacinum sp.]|nr:Extracellular ligand-binding receptor [Desulfacinum sp.]